MVLMLSIAGRRSSCKPPGQQLLLSQPQARLITRCTIGRLHSSLSTSCSSGPDCASESGGTPASNRNHHRSPVTVQHTARTAPRLCPTPTLNFSTSISNSAPSARRHTTICSSPLSSRTTSHLRTTGAFLTSHDLGKSYFSTTGVMGATKIDGNATAKKIRERLHAEIDERQKVNPKYQPSLKIIQGESYQHSVTLDFAEPLSA